MWLPLTRALVVGLILSVWTVSYAAISLVQTTAMTSVAASATTSPSITITGTVVGNTVVCYAAIYDANDTWILGTSTDGANTYTTRVAHGTRTGVDRIASVVSWSILGTGGSRTVQFPMSGTSGGSNRYYQLICQEWSGVAGEEAFFQQYDVDIQSTTITAGPITTTNAGDLLVGMAVFGSSDSAVNWVDPQLPSAWTNIARDNDSSTILGIDAASLFPGSTVASYTAAWGHDLEPPGGGGAFKGAGVIVALTPSGGGGGGGGAKNLTITGAGN